MSRLPCLTADLPGIGGLLKTRPEDFEVEELPLYEPSGTGTHTYFQIEKVGLPTDRAVSRIADALGVRRRDLGYAGLKDARAVTRQTLSIEHVPPERVAALELPSIKVLWTQRHTNKLKLGHLAGNRFTVKVRQAQAPEPGRFEAIADVLRQRGVPNYFGEQRFGLRGDNARIGLAALRGDLDQAVAIMLGCPDEQDQGDVLAARQHFEAGDFEAAGRAWPHPFRDRRRACFVMHKSGGSARQVWRSLDWPTRRMYLSAMQSELFNQVVARRIDGLDRLLIGDLAMKHANGAVFRVEDAQAEQSRCTAFEVSPTGPLVGRRMTNPEGEPAELEAAILAAAGLTPDLLRDRAAERIDGARRALRVQPAGLEIAIGCDDQGDFVQARFALPPGSYATVLMAELCKSTTDNLPSDRPSA